MTADQPSAPTPPSATPDDSEMRAIRRKFDREFWRTTSLQLAGVAILFAIYTWFNIAFP